MRGCVVMVSHDDELAVVPVLAEIDEAARALEPSGITLRVLLVDNRSSDATVEVARATAKQLGLDFEVLQLAPPPSERVDPASIAHHVLRGFRWALDDEADFIVGIDADGHHDGRQIPDLVRAHLARGSGITIGSRWVRGGSSPGTGVVRTIVSRGANLAVAAVTGVRDVHDATTSFRVYRPDAASLLTPETVQVDGYGFFSAFVAHTQAHGFTVDEVPITFRPRYSGVSAVAAGDVATFVRNLFTVRRQVKDIRATMRSNQALWAQRSSRLRQQTTTSSSTFGATEELGNLSQAYRFISWIVDELDPYLGREVLEVGAGMGAVTRTVAERHPEHRITAIEPAENLYDDLVTNLAPHPQVEVRPITSQQLLADGGAGRFDSVMYVSVLEHILDDVGELRTAHDLLRSGGHVAIFVPAMPSLYGSLDYKSGHYRRYDRDLLVDVLEQAGFELVDVHHLDVAGVFPYWLMYRVLDRQALDSASSGIFDRVIVPTSRLIQRVVPNPPLGKNLVAVARRR